MLSPQPAGSSSASASRRRRTPQHRPPPARCVAPSSLGASSGPSAAPSLAALTRGGLVALAPSDADAERGRLEATDAFAELVALSSLAGKTSLGQAPPAGDAFTPPGLKKPPWLRQRAPQGER